MQKSQDAFAKVENLKTQFPNEDEATLIKKAGVTRMAYARGRNLAQKSRRNQATQAQTKKKVGRRQAGASAGNRVTSSATTTTASKRQQPFHLSDGQMIAVIGTPNQIHNFLGA